MSCVFVSLDITFIIEGLFATNLKKSQKGGGCSKVIPRPSADSFEIGGGQKPLWVCTWPQTKNEQIGFSFQCEFLVICQRYIFVQTTEGRFSDIGQQQTFKRRNRKLA
jgi:hypothetical protein